MENAELLKNARNGLLKLHKALIDFERATYEGFHGKLTAGQFLNVLLENEDFSWLRKFSMLIVEIDEMFDLKDGIEAGMIEANLLKVRELVAMTEDDAYFRAKYQFAISRDVDAAALHSEIKAILSRGSV